MFTVVQVEIEVIGEGAIEVEESGLEEVVDAAKNAQAASDDSALALLADITSKYQQGEPALQVIKKGGIEEVYGLSFSSTLLYLYPFQTTSSYSQRRLDPFKCVTLLLIVSTVLHTLLINHRITSFQFCKSGKC